MEKKSVYISEPILMRALDVLVPVLLGIVYLMTGLYAMGLHTHIGETDTSAFFRYVLEVRAQGGPWDFLVSLFTGSFLPANQHPLFPFVISLFFEHSTAYFVAVKTLNLVLGGVFLFIFYYMMKREAGPLAAIAAGALLVANDTFMIQASMVSCEPMLLIFTTLSFSLLIKGVDDNRLWAPAGVFIALSFLVKGSGMFIIFGFGLFLLADARMRFWELLKNKYLWLFLAAFVVVALPLLARNTIAYKFPFYNYNTKYLAMDAEERRVNEERSFWDILKKDPSEHAERFAKGTARQFRILLHSLYSFSIHEVPKFTRDTDSPARKAAAGAVAALVFAAGVYGFARAPIGRKKKLLAALLVFGFYLPLSWYSIIAPNRRYILPVSLFFVAFAACVFARGLSAALERRGGKPAMRFSPETMGRAALAVALAIFAVAYPLARNIPLPSETVRLEDDYHELAAFFKKNLGDDGLYQTRGDHHYSWVLLYPELMNRGTGRGYFADIGDFVRYFDANPRIRFMLMQPELYRATRNILGDYVRNDARLGLVPLKDPPGWRMIRMDGNPPADYILYERVAGRGAARK